MILFKPEHAAMILAGRKTQTRRFWAACRVRLGSLHQCYTRPAFANPPGQPFATIKVTQIRRQAARDIYDPKDIAAEGYTSLAEYVIALARINRITTDEASRRVAWVIDFRLTEPPA